MNENIECRRQWFQCQNGPIGAGGADRTGCVWNQTDAKIKELKGAKGFVKGSITQDGPFNCLRSMGSDGKCTANAQLSWTTKS